jgi:hypothetical protein
MMSQSLKKIAFTFICKYLFKNFITEIFVVMYFPKLILNEFIYLILIFHLTCRIMESSQENFLNEEMKIQKWSASVCMRKAF